MGHELLVIDYISILVMVLMYCMFFYSSLPNPTINEQLKKLVLNSDIMSDTIKNLIAQWRSFRF